MLVFFTKSATFKRKTSEERSGIWKNNTLMETLNIVRGNQKQGWHVWGAGGAGKQVVLPEDIWCNLSQLQALQALMQNSFLGIITLSLVRFCLTNGSVLLLKSLPGSEKQRTKKPLTLQAENKLIIMPWDGYTQETQDVSNCLSRKKERNVKQHIPHQYLSTNRTVSLITHIATKSICPSLSLICH